MSDDTEIAPSPNGDNGPALSRAEGQADARDDKGRFMPGNPGGPGNPQARKVAELRASLVDSVTPDDLRAAIGKLVEKAKAGEPWAIRELLDRVLGKARQPIDLVPNDDTGGDGTISQHLTLLQAVINGMPEFKTAFPETRRIVATTENQPKDPQGSEQP